VLIGDPSLRWRITFLSCSVAGLIAITARGDVYTYNAAARPGSSQDATRQETGLPADVWNVILDGDLQNPDTSGTYDLLGNSADNGPGGNSGAGAGNPAWGLHAPSGGNPSYVSAFSSITNLIGAPLTHAGNTVSLQFDNGDVYHPANANQGSAGAVGINFYTFDNTGQPQLQTSFAIVGKSDSPTYEVDDPIDANQPTGVDTHIPITSDGFTVKLKLLDDAGHYSLFVNDVDVTGQRRLIEDVSSIAAIEVLTEAAGGDPMGTSPMYDTYFNQLAITVPEAPSIVMFATAAATIALSVWAGRRTRFRATRPSPPEPR
jgi:hypothetical protein